MPLLPRWDLLVREGGRPFIQMLSLRDCNCLQCAENTVCPVHTYAPHGHMAKAQPDHPRRRLLRVPDRALQAGAVRGGIEKMRVYGARPRSMSVLRPSFRTSCACRRSRSLAQRVAAAGKPPSAMMRKLVCVAYGVLRSGRPFGLASTGLMWITASARAVGLTV